MYETTGVSPKVSWPAALLAALGVLLLVVGTLSEDALVAAGTTLLAASGIQFGVGYKAPPGDVQPSNTPQPASDDLLPDIEPPADR